eukprot:scaffold5830_cov38-Cyclotella_meneghiniana.AAC.4
MEKLQNSYPDPNRDELIDMLGNDPEWRMHMTSDGQRRRDDGRAIVGDRLKKENRPSKMLAIADNCVPAELEGKLHEGESFWELACEQLVDTTDRQGGYLSGGNFDKQIKREVRLNDVIENEGLLRKNITLYTIA